MLHYDRLSALIAHFSITVAVVAPGLGNLIALGRDGKALGKPEPSRILFCPRHQPPLLEEGDAVLLEARVDLGDGNPLASALPDQMTLLVEDDGETALLLRLLLGEASSRRCGFGSVLNRLAEVLIIRLLRSEIERGAAEPGLLAGLAHPRISRAIIAIHEAPDRDWRNEDLAAIAGLSLSRFAELFKAALDETPQTYLRRWRMTLARQDIARGDRIKAVSRRYGYGSSEAFAKAFHRQFGQNPLATRRWPAHAGEQPKTPVAALS